MKNVQKGLCTFLETGLSRKSAKNFVRFCNCVERRAKIRKYSIDDCKYVFNPVTTYTIC